MNPELTAKDLQKPRRGDGRIAAHERRQERIDAEQAVMQAALKRDKGKCRFPRCQFAKFNLRIDPCHFLQHRGSGGNPSGDRTERTGQIVSLCRRHHDMLDRYLEIEVQAIDAERLADGPLAFFERDNETGQMLHIHTEPINYLSETRGA